MVTALATVFNALLIAWAVRRLLGIPVGWPRTLALSILVGGSSPAILRALSYLTGLPETTEGLTGRDAVGAGAGILLAVAWIIAFEIAALTLLEVLLPTGSLPGLVEFVRGWPRRVARWRRYAALTRIAVRHGLVGYARRSPRTVSSPHRGAGYRSEDSGTPARLRAALTDGGVTFVKLGQMLATRGDILPAAYVDALSHLHSDVPAQPWPTVRERIEEEVGRPLDAVFASVDPEPLAAASTAQVHAATLRTGEAVVVKVQRTDIAGRARADLDIIGRLARWLQQRTSWGARIGVTNLADGFAKALTEELDYTVEVANMAAIAATSGSAVSVPRVWPDLSTRRLIVMERVDGIPLSRSETQLHDLDATIRARLAGDLFDAVLRQIVHGGVFHADLHPGNIILTTGDGEPRLALLDFGSVGRLDRSRREALGLLLLAVNQEDSVAALDALCELLGRPDALDERALEAELGDLMLQRRGSAHLFGSLARTLTQNGFAVPPMVAAAFRAMAALEGSLRLLDPEFDLLEAGRERAGGVLAGHLAPGEVRQHAQGQLAQALPMLRRLPRRLDRITDQLDSGRLAVTVHPISSLADARLARGLVREVVTGLLCAALTVCGVALLIAGGGPVLYGRVDALGYLGGVLLLFGFVLGARLLAVSFTADLPIDGRVRSSIPD